MDELSHGLRAIRRPLRAMDKGVIIDLDGNTMDKSADP